MDSITAEGDIEIAIEVGKYYMYLYSSNTYIQYIHIINIHAYIHTYNH